MPVDRTQSVSSPDVPADIPTLLGPSEDSVLSEDNRKPVINRNVPDKVLYSYIRQSTRNKDPIPLLRTAEGAEISEGKAKADHLSQFFRCVETTEPGFPAHIYEEDLIPFIDTVLSTEV
ncbi:unnamed protein product [Dibothriocephalus latus]|uniref:Uncharacterized protein n=1 Tax=Dibothriocephalus latus TaxID=60516 RepID=A0A3P7P0F7_DIBLA|nr:unnamed protein product [Dibothriocephalus latus]